MASNLVATVFFPAILAGIALVTDSRGSVAPRCCEDAWHVAEDLGEVGYCPIRDR